MYPWCLLCSTLGFLGIITDKYPRDIGFGLSPLPVTVTTRIITFLVGDPYKPSFATVTGRGEQPNIGFILRDFPWIPGPPFRWDRGLYIFSNETLEVQLNDLHCNEGPGGDVVQRLMAKKKMRILNLDANPRSAWEDLTRKFFGKKNPLAYMVDGFWNSHSQPPGIYKTL